MGLGKGLKKSATEPVASRASNSCSRKRFADAIVAASTKTRDPSLCLCIPRAVLLRAQRGLIYMQKGPTKKKLETSVAGASPFFGELFKDLVLTLHQEFKIFYRILFFSRGRKLLYKEDLTKQEHSPRCQV
jgi:hypothetical protein